MSYILNMLIKSKHAELHSPAVELSGRVPQRNTPSHPKEHLVSENVLFSFHSLFPPKGKKEATEKSICKEEKIKSNKTNDLESDLGYFFHDQSRTLQILNKLLPPLRQLCFPSFRPAAVFSGHSLPNLTGPLTLLLPLASLSPPRSNFPHQHKV